MASKIREALRFLQEEPMAAADTLYIVPNRVYAYAFPLSICIHPADGASINVAVSYTPLKGRQPDDPAIRYVPYELSPITASSAKRDPTWTDSFSSIRIGGGACVIEFGTS